MDQIKYVGEELWLGTVGHFLVLLAFVSAGLSAYTYWRSKKGTDTSWSKIGRYSFIVHGVAIYSVIALLIFAMVNKMYEYMYVYRTVSDSLPVRYLLVAFWEDQEGSFLLWMFWHIFLGFILIKKAGKWESSVMIPLALIQLFITSMLLGLYVPFVTEDYKIGSNPFALIRDVFEGPIFANADYLTLIEGKGLNPLLQNYWMTIHPPVLFLGFASLAIPFCFSIAGLTTGQHKEVLPTVLKWSLFSGSIYGLGILMGGAWAYEALTFGGYWAWDPVENSSLVPWLILVGGIHTNLIAKSTGHAIKSTYVFYILAFIFILYSTFLTRSGVLGDTSVHAFTTMGLESQLTIFISFFVLYGLYHYFKNQNTIPTIEKEESIYSREFWMFIGSLVLMISGLMMTAATSLPLYNKVVQLFKPEYIGVVLEDQVSHHNHYQIWVGISMAVLMGAAMSLRYQALNWDFFKKKFVSNIAIAIGVSIILTILLQPQLNMFAWNQVPFLFAGVFAIVANAQHLLLFLKNNLKSAGSVISHMGFGVLILGILWSGLNREIVSSNPFGQGSFVEEQSAQKAIVLIKEQPFFAKDYWLTYEGDTVQENLRYYQVNFRKVNKQNETISNFIVEPNAAYNRDFTKIEAFNPGTRRTLAYDVFTAAGPPPHLRDIAEAQAMEDSLKYLSYLVTPGDTIVEPTYTLTIGDLLYNHKFTDNEIIQDYDLTVGIPIEVTVDKSAKTYDLTIGLGLKDGVIYQFPEVINELGIKIKLNDNVFEKIFTEEETLAYEDISMKQGETVKWGNYSVTLKGFDRQPTHNSYVAEENDIALGGQLEFSDGTKSFEMEPIFILRNAQPFSIKDYQTEIGVHARFSNIDPTTEMMTFRFARDNRQTRNLELLIAQDVTRSDILIVEATIIPAINLVWTGCLMMLAGLFMGLLAKNRKSA